MSIGITRRPRSRSHAARVVRASATPCPSTVASMSMLAWLRTGPPRGEAETPATSNHVDQLVETKLGTSCTFQAWPCWCQTQLRSLTADGLEQPYEHFPE